MIGSEVIEERVMLRRLITPHDIDNELLMEIDFSQMELRQLAMESGDPELLYCYHNGIDVHARTAAESLGVTMDEFNALPKKERKGYRQEAKPINFGVLTPN